VIIKKLHYFTSSDFALLKFSEEEKELYQAAKAGFSLLPVFLELILRGETL